jgi:hypothetical protein
MTLNLSVFTIVIILETLIYVFKWQYVNQIVGHNTEALIMLLTKNLWPEVEGM